MKILKVISLFVVIAMVVFNFGCTTVTSYESYKQASEGDTIVKIIAPGTPEVLKSATISALSARQWQVTSSGNPVEAHINHGGIYAVLKITFAQNEIIMDTKGSVADGRPIVPLRFINYLKINILNNLK